ncbi:hypothetical protein BSKO_12811 [Bryopsis sp. KO-2023]|nr:hypothetical protein BSKO_12811 [Bryopsis sp. KO-2023]
MTGGSFKGGGEQTYGITVDELVTLNEEKDVKHLQEKGGVEGVAKAVHSDLKHGLEESEVESHRATFGANFFDEVPAKTFMSLVIENIKDPIIILLIAAALVSTILGAAIKEQREEKGWVEGVAIWVAVFVVAFVGAANDYQKDQQFRKLNAQKEIYDVTVFRGGKETLVKNIDLVVGDVLVLDTGDKVTGDGVLFENHDLVIDEASLTGESEPIKKNISRKPFCRSGTQVTEGSGKVLLIAVGKNSEWGKTLSLVSGEGDETPLQEKLGELAAAIGKVGFFVAVLSFIVLTIRWMVQVGGWDFSKINQDGPIQFFLFAVTIVVVAVPEGLPLAVTISLAYSMKKMMKDNNFVRVLAACETMGGATAICSDKTGTLTENRMTVVEGWFHGVKHDKTPMEDELHSAVKTELVMNIALNAKAFLIDDDPDNIQFVGNRTECALLMLARKWNISYKDIRLAEEKNVVKLFGFSSAKKMASVLVKRDTPNGQVLRLYNKGASEMVLEQCTQVYNDQGKLEDMTKAKKEELLKTIEAMASRGLRTLALTYTDFPMNAFSFEEGSADYITSNPSGRPLNESPDENLILMSVVGIKDPVRQEVPAAVESCKTAGIFVRMVTGDNIYTAQHIARECGILTENGMAMEGPDFRRTPEEELKKILPRLQVLARSSPTDKHTLVHLLREMGEVVAVTGDGTNDAPALKESDVGLAMGITGTEVAKEAADIVILDDNFSSIVKAVLWGRAVFTNIRKFLQFQLTVNFVALVLAFVAAVAGGELPLNVLQLLWVNLIMDTMAALALATEAPTPDLLHFKPHGRNESLISRTMWKHIFLVGLYQLFWLFLMLYGLKHIDEERYGEPHKRDVYYDQCFIQHGSQDMFTSGGEEDSYQGLCNQLLDCNDQDMVCEYKPDVERVGLLKSFYKKELEEFFEDEEEDAFKRKASVIFNAFIFMQIFNELCARKVHDEFNFFDRITESTIFVGIFVVIVGLQLLIMLTPLGGFFKVIYGVKGGLNGGEWLYTVLIGLGVIPFSLLVRVVTRGCWKSNHLQELPSIDGKQEV